MGFLSDFFDADKIMGKKMGGLNTQTAMGAVRNIFDTMGDTVVKCADFVGVLPKEKELVDFISLRAAEAGVEQEMSKLLMDPPALGMAWQEINKSDWEEWVVEDVEADLTPYQNLIAKAKADKKLERAVQAATEHAYPQLYLFRALALGITATEENWLTRTKLNSFRNFFLRMALPGGKYDKYISMYIIFTSEKDAWDEMRHGQNKKLGFLVDSVANIGSVHLSSMFSAKAEKLLADKFRELTGQSPEEVQQGEAVGAESGTSILSCPECAHLLPPSDPNSCPYCGWRG